VKAAEYFKLSADQGHADAQLHYGLYLHTGNVVNRDSVKAAQYFELSADQGSNCAQMLYGIIMRDMEHIEGDRQRSTESGTLKEDPGDGSQDTESGPAVGKGCGYGADDRAGAAYSRL
jgi:TPR repeat protein